MSEKEFQDEVVELARSHGWKVKHDPPSKSARGRYMTSFAYDGAGWPDLVLVHPMRGVTLFRELKVPPNTTSDKQDAWLAWLSDGGNDAGVWTPADWPEIETVLTGQVSVVVLAGAK